MPTRAYVLIQTTAGRTGQAFQTLRGRPGLVAVDAVTGPYDIIATVEGKDVDEIGRIVLSQIQNVEGISRTVTCVAVAA
ncbi:MAG: Lrp/AsnC ligand binding domain-containing protein [Chloroflexi bacterium]|nr:Lrp/AsnC ligand binding domain-containing protein [Chloroflexota bacterium]